MDKQELDLYLMIFKTLEGGPFQETASALRRELESRVKETRTDYLGQQHESDLSKFFDRNPDINSNTLINICRSLKQLLDETIPPTNNYKGFMGPGQFSLLRTKKSLHQDAVRYAVASLLSNKLYCPAYKNYSINIVRHLQARKLRGPVCMRRSVPPEIYARTNLYKKLLGHLSSAYCVTFDHSGQYIFTGADDHLIKIWSARSGRLLRTLRGHNGEITDMSVNFENRLLASGGMDRVIRIWDLKTSKLLECLNAHSATVTSVKFAPYNRHGDNRYLISTSNDGSVIFWIYDVDKFQFRKLRKFQERNRPGGRIICSSFSTGGSFLACGSSDNYIHIYGFHPEFGPYWLSELDYHADQVDSIQFANLGFRFVTGSQDGTAAIWTFVDGNWKPLKLDMNTQLDQSVQSSNNQVRPRVLIVQWSRDDRYVLTSMVDFSIKVWSSTTGKLIHIMKEHQLEVYLIESHPVDPRIILSASHDGTMIIWDIENARVLKKFQNQISADSVINPGNSGPQVGSFFDVKWSPDGNMIAATDSYGFLSIYGVGSGDPYKDIPEQMFFHTDYRAVIRDMNHFVMDEQTHVAPHLMPRPTLVDMNGNPYPSTFQRFVPEYRDGERIVVQPLEENQLQAIAEMISNHSKQEDDEYLAQKRSPSDDLCERSGPSNSQSLYPDRPRSSVQSAQNARYNTRFSTRYSFRSARSNFMPRARRTRPRVRYYDGDEEDDENARNQQANEPAIPHLDRQARLAARQRQRQAQQQMPQRHQRERRRRTREAIESDSSTEEEREVEEEEENDDETVGETEEESTEIDTDEETVIDSDATEIDDSNIADLRPPRPSRPVRRTRSSANQLNSRESAQASHPVARRASARLEDRKRRRRS